MWKGMAPKFGGVFDWQEVALLKKIRHKMREEKIYPLIKMRVKGKDKGTAGIGLYVT